MGNKKFRKFFTSSGNLVVGGKNAEQNEELITKHLNGKDVVLHTKAAGSPFCVVKAEGKKISSSDIKEAAIFCATFSREWKKKKGDALVHIFKGKDIFKEKNMKIGTFGVKKFKEVKVKKKDIERFLEKWKFERR